MNRTVRNFALAAMFTAFAAPPALADRISEAGSALVAKDYRRARSLVIQYYGQGGAPRYRADFIRAVSECKLGHPAPGVVRRFQRLQSEYYLTPAVAAEVDRWISRCTPKPVQTASSSGVGVSVQAVEVDPSTNSLASVEPRRLAPMSQLAFGLAFRGGDYARVSRPSAQACQRTCQVEPRCIAMTFDTGERICWLKNRMAPAGHGYGWVSSRKLGN